MSVQSELTRLESAKAAIKAAIEGKGVTVPDGTLLDGMAVLIEGIQAGGGADSIIDRSVTSITSNVAEVGEYAFSGCQALTTVYFPVATTIRSGAFSGCQALTTVDLPAATTIGDSAFARCTALRIVYFPVATTIEIYAFIECEQLQTASFPSADTIGDMVFTMCPSLKTVDFPVATTIGGMTFMDCSALETVIIRSPAVCALVETGSFMGTPIASGTGYIYVPAALVDSYKAATNWTAYADQIRAIEDYPDICGGTT